MQIDHWPLAPATFTSKRIPSKQYEHISIHFGIKYVKWWKPKSLSAFCTKCGSIQSFKFILMQLWLLAIMWKVLFIPESETDIMWLGTKSCVQWMAKLGIFESKSVNIAFFVYYVDLYVIFQITNWFFNFLRSKIHIFEHILVVEPRKWENWPEIGYHLDTESGSKSHIPADLTFTKIFSCSSHWKRNLLQFLFISALKQ